MFYKVDLCSRIDLFLSLFVSISDCWASPSLISGASVADSLCFQLPNKGDCQLATVEASLLQDTKKT